MSSIPRTLSIPEPELKILNEGGSKDVKALSAVEASKKLQQLMLRMKGSFVSTDGLSVDYKTLSKSPMFSQYKDQCQSLQHIQLESLSDKQRKAFFINVYNALTIHGLITRELPSSVLSIQLFWKTTAYNIGGHVFSLDDMEHGILRGNRPHPASKTSKPFDNADPRLKLVLKEVDPRIHFALVCGAKSCPAIQVYTEENLDQALQSATSTFCAEEVKCYAIQKEIHVSKIFQWYCMDFGQNDVEAIRWTLPYLDSEKQKTLRSLLHTLEEMGMVDISYRSYDWNLNKV